jgi:hypothetical protein
MGIIIIIVKFRSGIWKNIFMVGKPGGKGLLERPNCKWEVILKWFLMKWFTGHGTGTGGMLL